MVKKTAIADAPRVPALSVLMVRDSLDNIPGYPLERGFQIVPYRDGDERNWLDIHIDADRQNTFSDSTFRRQFGTSEALLAVRQLYLLSPDRKPIGTASAWFKGALGRIHWVAIVPKFQGMGLAKPLLEAACLRLRSLGHRAAYLTTATNRPAALGLYTLFEFRPVPRSAAELEAWTQATRALRNHEASNRLLGHLTRESQ